jgi:hypothetical protein
MLNNYQGDLMSGKGDKPRDLIYTQEYRDNFDRIFGKRKKKKENKNVSKNTSK